MRSFVVRLIGVVVTAQLLACNQSDADQAKVHATRGDLAVEQQKFHEATIEYMNAVQHAQNDAAIRWKLVQASLQAADFDLAFKELHNLMRLDPPACRCPPHVGTPLSDGRKTRGSGQGCGGFDIDPAEPSGGIPSPGRTGYPSRLIQGSRRAI